MLVYLRIRGLALLDDVTLDLRPGMTVLTGETGAGKSIIVGALSLLRGARSRAEVVRRGEDSAVIDARFEPDAKTWARLAALTEALGIELGDIEDGLVVRRMVSKSGRSRAFVQDAPTTQAVLAKVGEVLVDICSQHEHHFLTHEPRHLEVLDAYAGCEGELAAYREVYGRWRAASEALRELREAATDRLQRTDYLRFQIEELERVAPEAGEHEQLQRRLTLLKNVQQWAEFADAARQQLYEGDDAIAGRLATMAARAEAAADSSRALSDIAEQLTAAQMACEEAARVASRLADELDVEPGELETVAERVHELQALRRKHGVDPDELPARLHQMKAELELLEGGQQREQQVMAQQAAAKRECLAIAKTLHDKRAAAADGLCEAVVSELAALHLEKARLSVRLTADTPDEPGPNGVDRAEFLFSANPGETLAPLSRVASGGELSRVLLALKGALSAEDRVATYVFDEVDAGVGGRVADAIGRRLANAAKGHQVLCVTHLPQIAAFASSHLRVDKQTRGGRTTTRVVALDPNERATELARMLGGAKASALQHAERMLSDAKKRPRRPRA